MHPVEERFWTLVSGKLAGEASPDDLAELAELLRAHPEWSLPLELYTNLYHQRPKPAPDTETPFSRHLQRLTSHLADPALQYETPYRRTPRPWLIAAATLVLAVTFFWLLKPANPAEAVNTVSTRPGNRSRIQLPDGTTVWLNADSRLTYKVNPSREVQLTGEAYFDVAKDPNHPFRVHTPTIDILVLGTAFNVRSYANEHNTETSLFQGSVEVTLRNNPDKKIILHPEEKLTVHNNESTVTNLNQKTSSPEPDPDLPLMTLGKVHHQQNDTSFMETGWTKNQLCFDNRTLEEVAGQLERWFNVHVTITDDNLKLRRFTAVFEDEGLAKVMEALRISGDFHYAIRKKEVIISP